MKNALSTKCGKMLLASMWTFAVRYLKKQKLLSPKDVIISLKRNQIFGCIPHTSSKHQSHFWSSSHLFVLQAVDCSVHCGSWFKICFFGVLCNSDSSTCLVFCCVYVWLNRALLGIGPKLSTTAFGSKRKTSTTENNCATADFTTALFYFLYNKQNPPIWDSWHEKNHLPRDSMP